MIFFEKDKSMADESDMADSYIAASIEVALTAQRIKDTTKRVGTRFCKACGERMCAVRRQLGLDHCVECAREREKREALYPSGF